MKTCVLLAFLLLSASAFAWMDSAWQYRTPITVNNSGSALSDYQVAVNTTNLVYNNTGLVGSWHFSEGTGTRAADSSGNGNDGTLTNGPTWVAGKYGNGLSFDGVNDYVDAGNGASLNFVSSDFTIEFWLYVPSLQESRSIVERGLYLTDGYDVQIYSIGANAGLIRFNTYQSGARTWFQSTGNYTANEWQHIAVVKQGSLGYIYRNSVDITPTSHTLNNPATSSRALVIGKQSIDNLYLNGTVDELRVYNRALSPQEIAARYNASKLRPDYADLRFANTSDSSLPHWMENDNKAWVKLPYIPSGTSSIYAYYGNPVAAGASSEAATYYVSNRKFDYLPLGRNWTCSASGYGACNAALTGDYASSPYSGYVYETARGCTRAHLQQNITLPDVSPLYLHYSRRYYCNTWGGPLAIKINATTNDWGSGTILRAWGCGGGGTTSAWAEFWDDISAFRGKTVMIEAAYHDSNDNDPTYCGYGDHGAWLRVDDFYISTTNAPVSPPQALAPGNEEAVSPAAILAIVPANKTTYPNYNETFTLWVYNNQTIADNFTLSCTGTCYYSENPVALSPYENRSVSVVITSANASGTAYYAIRSTSQANADAHSTAYASITADAVKWRDQWHDAYGNQFAYRVPITISNSGDTAVANYSISLTINTQALISSSKMRADCGDVRFTNGTHELDYLVESGCNATSTLLWAKAPSIPPGASGIYLYYGNPASADKGNLDVAYYISNRKFDYLPLGRNWTCSASGYGACNAALSGDYVSSPYSGYVYETARGCTRAHLQQNVTLPDVSPLYLNYSRRYWCNTWGGSLAIKINATTNDWGSGTILRSWGCGGGATTSAWQEFREDISAFRGKTVMIEAAYHDSNDNDPTYCGYGDHGAWLRVDNFYVSTNTTAISVLAGGERRQGYVTLVRRCGLKQDGANVTAYYAANATQAGSCLTNSMGICTLEINAGTYDLQFVFADNSTAWKNGTVFG